MRGEWKKKRINFIIVSFLLLCMYCTSYNLTSSFNYAQNKDVIKQSTSSLNAVWDKSTTGGRALSIIDIDNDSSFEILTASSSNVLNVYSLTGTILWTKTLDYVAKCCIERFEIQK